MSTADRAEYAAALRAHMLGSVTDAQRAVLELAREAARMPAGRYPMTPPLPPDGSVYTDPGDPAASNHTRGDTDRVPRRRGSDERLSEQISECARWPLCPVRDRRGA